MKITSYKLEKYKEIMNRPLGDSNGPSGEDLISSNILKIILRQLDEAPNYDFSYFNNSDIEWMDIIVFLENYIKEHLKLTQEFKSLDMIRNIAYE